MKTETNGQNVSESLDALDKLLLQVIQPIVEKAFSEKINENDGFQDGKDALKKIQMIKSTLDEMKNKINDLPDEDVLDTKFCEHSVPNGLAECADDIYWNPDPDKENENDNAFSVPIIKIRDNLLHEMSKEIAESTKKNLEETQKLTKNGQEELKAKFDDQKNIAEAIKKELLTELGNSTKEQFQMTMEQMKRLIRFLWCIVYLSCISLSGTLALLIFYLLRK